MYILRWANKKANYVDDMTFREASYNVMHPEKKRKGSAFVTRKMNPAQFRLMKKEICLQMRTLFGKNNERSAFGQLQTPDDCYNMVCWICEVVGLDHTIDPNNLMDSINKINKVLKG